MVSFNGLFLSASSQAEATENTFKSQRWLYCLIISSVRKWRKSLLDETLPDSSNKNPTSSKLIERMCPSWVLAESFGNNPIALFVLGQRRSAFSTNISVPT